MQTAAWYAAMILRATTRQNLKNELFYWRIIFRSESKRPVRLGQFLQELTILTPWHMMAIMEFNIDGMNHEHLFSLFQVFLIFQLRQDTA